MSPEELQKLFFRPICNESEIERIFNVRNAADYLLKIRAETLVDHMRLFRVYRNKALSIGNDWSLEKSFNNEHYTRVLEKMPKAANSECQKVCFGDVFSNDPNGMIFHTNYGPITTISDSLPFFLKFAHLAIMDFKEDVPSHVRLNALRISIRVMLKTEAMDFYMDPRGILPKNIAESIHAPLLLQKQFIAGHEFSHYVLGHLSEKSLRDHPVLFAVGQQGQDYKIEKIYNNSQRDEFDADLQSILLPEYSQDERSQLLSAALLWFCCLELFEAASDVMFPKSSFSYQTHPQARDRYENILSNVPTPNNFDLEGSKKLINRIDYYKQLLQEDISLNFDHYESYGSFYLDEPDSLWRGKELIDREDYY